MCPRSENLDLGAHGSIDYSCVRSCGGRMKKIKWSYLLSAALLAPGIYLPIIIRRQFDLEALLYIFILLPLITVCIGLFLLIRGLVKKQAPTRSFLLSFFYSGGFRFFFSDPPIRCVLRCAGCYGRSNIAHSFEPSPLPIKENCRTSNGTDGVGPGWTLMSISCSMRRIRYARL